MKLFSGKKILVFIDRYGLAILAFMGIAVLVAATLESLSRGSAVLKTAGEVMVGIVVADAKDATSLAKLFHVIWMLLVSWASAKVILTSLGNRWDGFKARYLISQHIVILAGCSSNVGVGFHQNEKKVMAGIVEDNTALAIDMAFTLSPKNKVVLGVPGLNRALMLKLWESGVTVITEELDLVSLIKAAGISRAKKLVAMRNNYSENLVLVRMALSDSIGNSKVECKCMIEPLAVKQSFKIEDYIEEGSLARVRAFNAAEVIGRSILRTHPPDASVAQSYRGVHLLLIGFGEIGQSVVTQLARIGHYKSEKRPKVTIVDGCVEEKWAKLTKILPALSSVLEVELFECRIEDIKDEGAAEWLQDEVSITQIYVCTKDEIANLRIARLMLKLLQSTNYQNFFSVHVVALDPPGGCVLEEFASRKDVKPQFKIFSLIKSQSDKSIPAVVSELLTDADDELAKALHKEYVREEDVRLKTNPLLSRKPAHTSWEYLAETFRDANRAAAEHVNVKLRAVGRGLALRGSGVESPLTIEEIELLARMEHDRWSAERLLDGWTYSTARDDSLRQHNDLRPYEELSEGTKQYDRNLVIQSIRIAAGRHKILVQRS